MPALKVYGKSDCVYCEMAKTYLESKSFQYDYIDADIPANVDALRLIHPAFLTVPQILIGSRIIGGFEELTKISTLTIQELVSQNEA
ncbi:MAG: glutaredoxin family protein [Undibacterium sp.]